MSDIDYIPLIAIGIGITATPLLVRITAIHLWIAITLVAGLVICSFGAFMLLTIIIPSIHFFTAATVGAIGWCLLFIPDLYRHLILRLTNPYKA